MRATRKRLWAAPVLLAAASVLALALGTAAGAVARKRQARVVVLMVWDGLRPDLVNAALTPRLFALARRGAVFAAHHSLYPTLTLPNAAALATGAAAGVNGILGDELYFGDLPGVSDWAQKQGAGAAFLEHPLFIEKLEALRALHGVPALGDRLVATQTITEELYRRGGYVAVLGKTGPAFLFAERLAGKTIFEGGSAKSDEADYLFVADQAAAPASARALMRLMPALDPRASVPGAANDAYFARLAAEQALPKAAQAARSGHDAMVVLWLHNPDLTQHLAGLGTEASRQALQAADHCLGTLEQAIARLQMAAMTDLIVVSDHGFATIKARVDLAGVLGRAGFEREIADGALVVARNGGSDLVYLSRSRMPSPDARRALLKRLVVFLERQPWCGPVFSAPAAGVPLGVPRPADYGTAEAAGDKRLGSALDYRGVVPGTFSQSLIGLWDPGRSPHLVVSFREWPMMSNRGLTGAANPACLIDRRGTTRVGNHSRALAAAVPGVVYADSFALFTTGMGMHGAVGRRELHNFGAAAGPDFRRGFEDRLPTSNADVAVTMAALVGLLDGRSPALRRGAGRVIVEALVGRGRVPAQEPAALVRRVRLREGGACAVSVLRFSAMAGLLYLDAGRLQHQGGCRSGTR